MDNLCIRKGTVEFSGWKGFLSWLSSDNPHSGLQVTSRSGLLPISGFVPCTAPEMGCVLLVSFSFATSHHPPLQQTHQTDHSPLYLKAQLSFVNHTEACCNVIASAWHSGHTQSGSSLDLRLGSLWIPICYPHHNILPLQMFYTYFPVTWLMLSYFFLSGQISPCINLR